MTTTREVHLTARPHGEPRPDDFELVERDLPDPAQLADGEVLVRNTVLSVDPYMRGRMNDAPSYIPPFALNAPLDGGAVGVVEASTSPRVAVGDVVSHMAGWREHAVLPARQVRVLDTTLVPDTAYLGVLGMPGLTAYVGLRKIAQLREGDAVFISGAAGAVGSLAGQLARKLGAARVIGSAGTADKAAWLTDELGFDVALNYRDSPIAQQLAAHAPIDVYFDNVGGDHLEAAIGAMSDFGRAALCGAIQDYNATSAPTGPRNMAQVVMKRLSLGGFIVTDHLELTGEFFTTVAPWVAAGEISYRETYFEGIENAVAAFLGLSTGANTGKMLVRLGH